MTQLIADILLISMSAGIVVAIEYLAYRDLKARGLDPIAVMVLLLLFTPIGLVLWYLRRRGHERVADLAS